MIGGLKQVINCAGVLCRAMKPIAVASILKTSHMQMSHLYESSQVLDQTYIH